MLYKLCIRILILCTFLICANAGPHGDGFCYKDPTCAPTTWGKTCRTGNTQSPINIPVETTKKGLLARRLRFNRDYFSSQDNFFVKNNGHTLQLSLKEDLTSNSIMDGDGLSGSYVFSQLHFHWGSHDDVGSEHLLNGRAFAAELHLVHYNQIYGNLTAAVASNNPRALVVLGVFMERARADNPVLKSIVDSISSVNQVSDNNVAIKSPLNLTSLLPNDLSLFRYEGSLTTPFCAEVVHWNVFKKSITIGLSQIDMFRKMQDASGSPLVDNYRPPQPLGKRSVYEYVHEKLDMKPGPNDSDDKKPFTRDGDDDPEPKPGGKKSNSVRMDLPSLLSATIATMFVGFMSKLATSPDCNY